MCAGLRTHMGGGSLGEEAYTPGDEGQEGYGYVERKPTGEATKTGVEVSARCALVLLQGHGCMLMRVSPAECAYPRFHHTLYHILHKVASFCHPFCSTRSLAMAPRHRGRPARRVRNNAYCNSNWQLHACPHMCFVGCPHYSLIQPDNDVIEVADRYSPFLSQKSLVPLQERRSALPARLRPGAGTLVFHTSV